MKPTVESYDQLQKAYDFFNRELFGSKLSNCLITLQREKRAYGYFSPDRFQRKDGVKTDEIVMNPIYFGVRPLTETFNTLVHEMCHLWQEHFGKPGRGRYHNREWAKKMLEVGLTPSSTGAPGGAQTGDHVSGFPTEGGRFLEVCRKFLVHQPNIAWYDRYVPTGVIGQGGEEGGSGEEGEEGEEGEGLPPGLVPVGKKSNRSKYTCGCGINVWGKPRLNVFCGECGAQFEENQT